MRETPLTARSDVGLFLLGARLRAGLTEQQIADRTGLTVETVKKFEDHQHAVDGTVGDFVAIATASGVQLVGRQAEGDEQLPTELLPDGSLPSPPQVLPPWQPGERRSIYMNDIAMLPHALKMARIKAVLSVHQASARTGINEISMYKHENGTVVPTAPRLAKYAEVYDCEFVIGPPTTEPADG